MSFGARGSFDATPVHANMSLKLCTALCGAQGYAEMTPVHRFCYLIIIQDRIATASRWESRGRYLLLYRKGICHFLDFLHHDFFYDFRLIEEWKRRLVASPCEDISKI